MRSQLEAVDRRILAIYSGVDDYIGVLPSGEFHGANLSGDPLGETKGATRSFSAGYLVSQFTLVIGEKSPQSGDRPLTTAATVTTGPVESSGHGKVSDFSSSYKIVVVDNRRRGDTDCMSKLADSLQYKLERRG